MRATGHSGEHISGAEGIFPEALAQKAADAFVMRGMNHPRGRAASITITMNPITKTPGALTALPVKTLICHGPQEADAIIQRLLLSQRGITERAVRAAMKVVRGAGQMRGAALICAQNGKRLEPDRGRGVRASMLGLSAMAKAILMRKLAPLGTSAETAFEAITLATKTASAPGILAELCVSDDPDYTTGYVASRRAGYIRIPNIKTIGSKNGGRVFFVSPCADINRIIAYLEDTPVMVSRIDRVSLRGMTLNSL